MNKRVYLSNLEWEKFCNDMGGVKANLIFKDSMSYEEYRELLKKIYFILNDIDLQQENEQLKSNWNILKEWLKTNEQKYFTFQPRMNGKTLQVGIKVGLDMVLDKMNELEGDKDGIMD